MMNPSSSFPNSGAIVEDDDLGPLPPGEDGEALPWAFAYGHVEIPVPPPEEGEVGPIPLDPQPPDPCPEGMRPAFALSDDAGPDAPWTFALCEPEQAAEELVLQQASQSLGGFSRLRANFNRPTTRQET